MRFDWAWRALASGVRSSLQTSSTGLQLVFLSLKVQLKSNILIIFLKVKCISDCAYLNPYSVLGSESEVLRRDYSKLIKSFPSLISNDFANLSLSSMRVLTGIFAIHKLLRSVNSSYRIWYLRARNLDWRHIWADRVYCGQRPTTSYLWVNRFLFVRRLPRGICT